MSLTLTPITLAEANAFVKQYHRHHQPVPGCKFCLAVSDDDKVVGVAIVGRPVSRHMDDGWTLEVNRTCTDGTKIQPLSTENNPKRELRVIPLPSF
jgi:hypothetical protein